MKKIIAILLAAVLLLSLTTAAFADNYWYGPYYESKYSFSEESLGQIRLESSEAMSKAEGYAALYRLIVKLQENGIYVMNYEVLREKSANYVFWLDVISSEGYVWSGVYSTYTHWSAESVVKALLEGKKVSYYSIFLTEYVEGQKIKDYADNQMITSFEASPEKAIDEFINFMNNYENYYDYYYGDGDQDDGVG